MDHSNLPRIMEKQPEVHAAPKHEVNSSGAPSRTEGSIQDDAPIEYPGAMRLFLIMTALCLAVFLVALDQTIIATAVPKITDEFKALDDVGWYGSSYMLTLCAFQLVYGKLYTFFSLKWIFVLAVGLFEIGSVLCAIAPTSTFLICGRAVAGLGCSGIFSGALVIIAHSVALAQRPLYTGIISAMYGIASVAGPLLGGIFTDSQLTWRWCFWINLPVGAVTLAVIIFFFQAPQMKRLENLTRKEKLAKFDLLGTAFFIPAIVSLLLALQWGGTKYSWQDKHIIGLLVCFGVLATIFTIIQYHKGDDATLPFRIMGQRTVASSTLFAVCIGGAFFMVIYYLPIWFQAIQGVSATKSGIRNLPLLLGVVVMAMVAGAFVTFWGYYTPFMILSSIVTSIGAGLLTTWTVHTPPSKWIGYQVITGNGLGFGMQQPLMAVQTVLSIEDVPIGTAAIVFFQSLGGAVFIAVAENVMQKDLIAGLTKVIPGFEPSMAAGAGATNLRELVPPVYLDVVIEAFNHALTRTYMIPTALGAISIVGALATEWKSVKGTGAVGLA